MPAIRSREVALAASGLALLTAGSIAVAIFTPASSEHLPPGSSFSHGPDGSAAAYVTLGRLGYLVRRSSDPMSALAIDPPSTVLILADPIQGPSNADRRALQSLAAAGATVLVTGCSGVSFLLETGLLADAGVRPVPVPYTARFPSPL
jgi:Domain of unknown function (DUF4350)